MGKFESRSMIQNIFDRGLSCLYETVNLKSAFFAPVFFGGDAKSGGRFSDLGEQSWRLFFERAQIDKASLSFVP